MRIDLTKKDDRDGFHVLYRYWGWCPDYGDTEFADEYYDDTPEYANLNKYREHTKPSYIELTPTEVDALLAAHRAMQHNYEFLRDISQDIGRVDALVVADDFAEKLRKNRATMKAHRTTPKKIRPVASARKMIGTNNVSLRKTIGGKPVKTTKKVVGTNNVSLKKTIGRMPNFNKNFRRIN